MSDLNLINDIKRKLAAQEYRLAKHDEIERDISVLLNLLAKKEEKIQVIAQQNMELVQEMENIRADFGDGSR